MKKVQRNCDRRIPIGPLACALVFLGSMPVHAGPAAIEKAAAAGVRSSSNCAAQVNNTVDKLLDCVSLEGVRSHQAALQAIADANGGSRAAGTSGYEQSVAYVASKLTAAGYDVKLNPFPFVFVAPATLQQTGPTAATFETGAFTGTGYGGINAPITAVDINLVPPRASTSGCEAADFAGFPVGNVALIQRGTCTFAVKALKAQAAGASAAIIFNQGNTSLREDPIVGTLAPAAITIPVVGASFATGVALAVPQSQVSINVQQPQNITLNNVIAESRSGDPNNVVMVGAHLDSVERGPGINDNGSGSAAILETAIQMAKVKPRNKLRFAWWGAEEAGLVGSTEYVKGLTEPERTKIALYLNFDMVGSPNHGYFIYDGDDSDGEGAGPGPQGSAYIEQVFENFFIARGLPFKGTDFSGRSDYGPFIKIGIPSGGLFTGAEGVKTAEEASIFGGTAGVPYDSCYHLACDTLSNVNLTALRVNSQAIAYSTLLFSMNTAPINDKRGKGNFKYPAFKFFETE